jgi:AbrB family looped-hinge helix DNA binding protein
MATAVKITRKGQVTIPRKIRDRLATEVVEFDIINDEVVLRPLISVAGSLRDHAKKQAVSFEKARDKAWDSVVREKHGKKTGRR